MQIGSIVQAEIVKRSQIWQFWLTNTHEQNIPSMRGRFESLKKTGQWTKKKNPGFMSLFPTLVPFGDGRF